MTDPNDSAGSPTKVGAAQAVFLASLPRGVKGQLIPGHTTWDDLGPEAKGRYRRMAAAAGEP